MGCPGGSLTQTPHQPVLTLFTAAAAAAPLHETSQFCRFWRLPYGFSGPALCTAEKQGERTHPGGKKLGKILLSTYSVPGSAQKISGLGVFLPFFKTVIST